MERREFLQQCAGFAGTVLLGTTIASLQETQGQGDSKARSSRPNIVLFFVDDLGWRDVGFMGSTYYETPHIDRLAAEGMVFTQAYANAANCAPSRASLMSGQYTPRHGIYTVGTSARGNARDHRLIPIENMETLPTEKVTIAEVLAAVGYVSASMGKWHLGDPPSHGPKAQGFDVNVGGYGAGNPKGGYFSPYNNPYLADGPEGEYLTDRLTEEAVAFIKANRERPFFLYLTHYAVHTPIQAKEEMVGRYRDKKPEGRHDNPKYAAMVESVDESVQAVCETLDSLVLSANTVVIFFSDNGGYGGVTGMEPLRGSKGMFYEGGIREPMIVRWTGVTRPGSRCEMPVIGVDFLPTLAEIAQAPLPAEQVLDGVSLVGLLRGGTSLDRESLYWHFPAYLQGNLPGSRDKKFRTRPVSVIRKGDWKLLLYHEEWVLDGGWEKRETNHAVELYDLGHDLSEATDLATQRPEKRDELLKDLLAWIETTHAPIPTQANEAYRG